MGNRYTFESNAGHGRKAARLCVALSDVELGRLRDLCRKMAPGKVLTQSEVIRRGLDVLWSARTASE